MWKILCKFAESKQAMAVVARVRVGFTSRKERRMSIIKFIKDWTLPVAMASGTIIYLIFAFTPALNGIATAFAPIGDSILPLFMFLILFVTFCKVDFKKLRPVHWHLWVGIFQVLFVFIIVGLVISFQMKGNSLILMEAILTCIIGPCAAAAPVITAKLGGSLEQMTAYTFLSNIITAVLIPICFPLIDKAADISFMAAFLKILYEVCIVLLVPMLLAFIVKHTLHRFHHWITSIKDLSYYLWGGSLMIVTGTTVKNIVHADNTLGFLLTIALLGLVLCIIQFSVGRFIGHYFDSVVESGQALGQKNTAFAIWIAYTYLNPLSSVGPGCYILWQNIINSVELWLYRRKGLEQAS
jgi:BASS family bile acid:Na+ symporter